MIFLTPQYYTVYGNSKMQKQVAVPGIDDLFQRARENEWRYKENRTTVQRDAYVSNAFRTIKDG